MTPDIFAPPKSQAPAPERLDYSRRHGTCPCGRKGRLWLLRGELRCNRCLGAAETEIARQANERAARTGE